MRRIRLWTVRRKMSNASWLEDMIQLKKTLALCKGCTTTKMPWRWEQKLHYAEMKTLHGSGHCDLCRKEDLVSLYQNTDTAWYEQIERDNHLVAATVARDFRITDRRRVRL
jgi:hypothetical protein